MADLSRPLPLDCIARIEATKNERTGKTRPPQDYLKWHTVAAILDTYAPGWEGSIVRVEKIGDRIAVTYRIAIHAAEGTFSQEDAGMEDEDKDEFGDTMTNAIATAMKRAAAKFGVGRTQLYDKERKTVAFLAHVREEKQKALEELGIVADAKGYPRRALLAWLCRQAGVLRASDVPTYMIKAMARQLEARPDVFHGDPTRDAAPTHETPLPGLDEDLEHLDPVTGQILDAWEEEEQREQQERDAAALLAQTNT